ncbi:hypothetical protein [Micromonospora sp. 15K316]|uniref:hypothetical protein n=1 Tax=Micromonospora sp. 15K316 TaxID=2530376 RepID=UPI001FB720DC|nr:hypothetical protein [Micromonospora sp. 15K316]
MAQWPGDERTLLLGVENVGVYGTSDGRTFTRVGVPGQPVNQLAVTGGGCSPAPTPTSTARRCR